MPSFCRPAGRSDAAEPGHEPQPRDLPHRLADDGSIHLALPLGPVDEYDRNLPKFEPFSPCAHAHLDLKGITVGNDLGKIDRFEHPPAKALEPTRQIPNPEAREPAGIDVGEVR